MLLYEAKETEFPEIEQFRELERVVLLQVIDRKWMDPIDDMDQLRQGIGLQAYGQRDQLVEYKMAGFDMFDEMIAGIQEDTSRLLYHVQVEQKVCLLYTSSYGVLQVDGSSNTIATDVIYLEENN